MSREEVQEVELQLVWYDYPEDYLRSLELKIYEKYKARDPFAPHPDELLKAGMTGQRSPWLCLRDLGFKVDANFQRSFILSRDILVLEADLITHQRLIDFHRDMALPLKPREIAELE